MWSVINDRLLEPRKEGLGSIRLENTIVYRSSAKISGVSGD